MALANYCAVFYSDAATNDAYWFKEAALRMGGLQPDNVAAIVSRLGIVLPQLQNSPFLKRLAGKD
jgi:hypothetical protein